MSTVRAVEQQLHQAILLGDAAPYDEVEQKLEDLSPKEVIKQLGAAAECLMPLRIAAGDAATLAGNVQYQAEFAARNVGAVRPELSLAYEQMSRQGRLARNILSQLQHDFEMQQLALQSIIAKLQAATLHLVMAAESLESARDSTTSAKALVTGYVAERLRGDGQSFVPEKRHILFLLSDHSKRIKGVNRHAVGMQDSTSTNPLPVTLNARSRLASLPLECISRPTFPVGDPNLVPHPGKLAVVASGGPPRGAVSSTLAQAHTTHYSYATPRLTGVINTVGHREQRHPEVKPADQLRERRANKLPDQLVIDSYSLPTPPGSFEEKELLTDTIEVLLRGYVVDAATRLMEYVPNSQEMRFTEEAQKRGLRAAPLHESRLQELFLGHGIHGLNRIVIMDTYTRGTEEPAVAAVVNALRRLGCMPVEGGIQSTRIAAAPVIEICFTHRISKVLAPSTKTTKELPG